jgi:Histone methylation protein DOT1
MVNSDFLNLALHDWTDADVVFANSVCFDDELYHNVTNLALKMKKGAFFISFTKRLPSADFVVLEYSLQQQSWGSSTVFIMQKAIHPQARGS